MSEVHGSPHHLNLFLQNYIYYLSYTPTTSDFLWFITSRAVENLRGPTKSTDSKHKMKNLDPSYFDAPFKVL